MSTKALAAGECEIRDEILEYLRTHGNQGDVIVISYMVNDLFSMKAH